MLLSTHSPPPLFRSAPRAPPYFGFWSTLATLARSSVGPARSLHCTVGGVVSVFSKGGGECWGMRRWGMLIRGWYVL